MDLGIDYIFPTWGGEYIIYDLGEDSDSYMHLQRVL